MAEIKPMALIESMRKKVCMHSDVYFRTNKQTGKTFTGKLCYPSNQSLRKRVSRRWSLQYGLSSPTRPRKRN